MREEIYLQYFVLILTGKIIEITESNREYNENTVALLQQILDELRKEK